MSAIGSRSAIATAAIVNARARSDVCMGHLIDRDIDDPTLPMWRSSGRKMAEFWRRAYNLFTHGLQSPAPSPGLRRARTAPRAGSAGPGAAGGAADGLCDTR